MIEGHLRDEHRWNWNNRQPLQSQVSPAQGIHLSKFLCSVPLFSTAPHKRFCFAHLLSLFPTIASSVCLTTFLFCDVVTAHHHQITMRFAFDSNPDSLEDTWQPTFTNPVPNTASIMTDIENLLTVASNPSVDAVAMPQHNASELDHILHTSTEPYPPHGYPPASTFHSRLDPNTNGQLDAPQAQFESHSPTQLPSSSPSPSPSSSSSPSPPQSPSLSPSPTPSVSPPPSHSPSSSSSPSSSPSQPQSQSQTQSQCTPQCLSPSESCSLSPYFPDHSPYGSHHSQSDYDTQQQGEPAFELQQKEESDSFNNSDNSTKNNAGKSRAEIRRARAARNRSSARRSRLRKKAETERDKEKALMVEKRNIALKEQVKQLHDKMISLQRVVEALGLAHHIPTCGVGQWEMSECGISQRFLSVGLEGSDCVGSKWDQCVHL